MGLSAQSVCGFTSKDIDFWQKLFNFAIKNKYMIIMNRKHFICIWMLLASLVPQMARAKSYMKDAANYPAMTSGKNTIDLSLPTFDYYTIGKNVYQSERSRIKAVVGNDTIDIFGWKSLGNNWTDKSAAICWMGESFTILCEQYGMDYSNQVVLLFK